MKGFWKGEETFSLKEIQNLDFSVFLLYPKIRIHSENRSFPYCKCVLQWCCTNSRKFFHNNHSNIIWMALLSNILSNKPGSRATPRILPATAEWPESVLVHASASATSHLHWPTQPQKWRLTWQDVSLIPNCTIQYYKTFLLKKKKKKERKKETLADYIVEPNSTLDV